MHIRIFTLLLLVSALPLQGVAQEVTAPHSANPAVREADITPPSAGDRMILQPISGWGELRFPSSEQPEDEDNLILEGAFEKRLDMMPLTDTLALSGFMGLGYARDSKNYDYNNKIYPSIGAKLRYFPLSNLVVEAGVEYEWDFRLKRNRTLHGMKSFIDWFSWWDIADVAQNVIGGQAWPGFTWGGMSYPGAIEAEERHNIILEGEVEQGVDWHQLTENTTLNSFATFGYVFDTKGYDWNNHLTYGIGTRVRIALPKGLTVQPGVEYVVNTHLNSGTHRDKLLFLVEWYF